MLLRALNLVKKTNPKVFLPYAGHFKEFAARDKIILKNNQKNNYDDVKNFFNKHKIKSKIIDLEKNDNLIFENKKLKITNLYIESKIKKEKVEEEIFLFKKLNSPKNYIKLISNYFLKSDFNANLILVLKLSDDNFKQIENSFFINFSGKKIIFETIDLKKIDHIQKHLKANLRYLEITARKDSLIYTINNKLPFEDLLIGFQIQVLR